MLDLNLADLALPDQAVLEILNGAGAGTGWVWTIAGPGHAATIAADEGQTKSALSRIEDQERARVNGRKWKGSNETPDEVRSRNIDYMTARVLGWTEGMSLDGKPFGCTPDNVRAILRNQTLGVYEQVNEFLRDERSFTKRSPKT